VIKSLEELADMSKFSGPRKYDSMIKMGGRKTEPVEEPAEVAGTRWRQVAGLVKPPPPEPLASKLRKCLATLKGLTTEVASVEESGTQEERVEVLNVLRDGLVGVLNIVPADPVREKSSPPDRYTGQDVRMSMLKAVLARTCNNYDIMEVALWAIGFGCDQLKGGKPVKRFDKDNRSATSDTCHEENLSSGARIRLKNVVTFLSRAFTGSSDAKLTAHYVEDGDLTPVQCHQAAMTFALRQLVPRLDKNMVLTDTRVHAIVIADMAEQLALLRHKRRISAASYRLINSLVRNMESYKLLGKDINGCVLRPLPAPSMVRRVWHRSFGKVDVLKVLGDGKVFKTDGVRCKLFGKNSVLWAVFNLAAYKKHFVDKNPRKKAVQDGKVILLRGSLDDEHDFADIKRFVRWLKQELEVKGITMEETMDLHRHGPRIDLIDANGDDEQLEKDTTSYCRKIQFDTPEAARAAIVLVNTLKSTRFSAHPLQELDCRAGGDAGEVIKGSSFTLQGLTFDSKLSNTMLAFLPYALYNGLDDASNMFHYCGDNRKELQQLSRGVVSYKDAEGKLQFLQLNIRGAGDGAHLPVPPRPARPPRVVIMRRARQ